MIFDALRVRNMRLFTLPGNFFPRHFGHLTYLLFEWGTKQSTEQQHVPQPTVWTSIFLLLPATSCHTETSAKAELQGSTSNIHFQNHGSSQTPVFNRWKTFSSVSGKYIHILISDQLTISDVFKLESLAIQANTKLKKSFLVLLILLFELGNITANHWTGISVDTSTGRGLTDVTVIFITLMDQWYTGRRVTPDLTQSIGGWRSLTTTSTCNNPRAKLSSAKSLCSSSG